MSKKANVNWTINQLLLVVSLVAVGIGIAFQLPHIQEPIWRNSDFVYQVPEVPDEYKKDFGEIETWLLPFNGSLAPSFEVRAETCEQMYLDVHFSGWMKHRRRFVSSPDFEIGKMTSPGFTELEEFTSITYTHANLAYFQGMFECEQDVLETYPDSTVDQISWKLAYPGYFRLAPFVVAFAFVITLFLVTGSIRKRPAKETTYDEPTFDPTRKLKARATVLSP